MNDLLRSPSTAPKSRVLPSKKTATAFRDDKLYAVFEDHRRWFTGEDERWVPDGRISPKIIKPAKTD